MQSARRTTRLNKGTEKELSDISDISCPELSVSESTEKKSIRKKKKRNKFSYLEDIKMLKYIMTENRYDEIKGIALWKDMELLEITTHTSQSMKYHFLNIVIPNLHKYSVDKSWVNTLFQNYPDLIPSTRQKRSNSILDTLQIMKPVLRNSSPSKAANKALSEWKDLQSEMTSLQQKQQEEDDKEEEVAEGDKMEVDISEDEMNDDEEQSLKQRQSLKKYRFKHKVKALRKLSTSESEIEDASVVTSTKETDHCVQNHQDSFTEEPTDTSDYDKRLIDMAKKTVCNNNPSQERLSESSSSSELVEQVPQERRSRLIRKRKQQKMAQQSNELPSTSRSEVLADTSSASEHTEQTSSTDFVVNEETDNSSHQRNSDDKRVKTNEQDFVIKIINDMCSKFQLDVGEVLSTLGSTNGYVNQAISYIKFGPKLSGVLPWTQKEDDIISSTNEQQLKGILQKRGHIAVAQRLQFLENL